MKDDWGLCVGVGTYLDDAHLDSLPGAAWDAERFYKFLIDEAAIPESQCELVQSPLPPDLLDQISPAPTAEKIEKWFRELIRIGVKNRKEGKGFVVGRLLRLYLAV